VKQKYIIPVLVVLCSSMSTSCYAQNKIDKSKKELTEKEAIKSNQSTSSSSRSSIDVDEAGPLVEILGYVFLGFFKYGMIGDYENENHLYNTLSSYPYCNQTIGNYKEVTADSLHQKFFRLDIKDHFLYSDKNLYGNHMTVKLRAAQYLHLQTDFFQVYEFQKIEKTSDCLALYYFNLGYDRIRAERFNFGWTLGASYVGGEIKKAGFSYGLHAEYFMNQKVSFGIDSKWSKISSQPVNSLGIDGKFHKKNYFIAIGYQYLKIATPTYNFVSLGGGIYL
jgi:hypothetical protein